MGQSRPVTTPPPPTRTCVHAHQSEDVLPGRETRQTEGERERAWRGNTVERERERERDVLHAHAPRTFFSSSNFPLLQHFCSFPPFLLPRGKRKVRATFFSNPLPVKACFSSSSCHVSLRRDDVSTFPSVSFRSKDFDGCAIFGSDD